MARKTAATTTATMPELDGLVNLETAAEVLGVSHGSVKNHIRRGDLASVKLGARRMIRRSELARFIASLES